jgi:DNA-directed RNA polymerase subunit RPC12/RpoP
MHCPDCGKSNPAGSVYCNYCGKKLPTVDFDGTVKCPFCGEPGQEYRYNCTKCGKELPRDSEGKPLRTEVDLGKKFCRRCGRELGAAVTVCPYCGASTGDVWSGSSSSGSSYSEDGGSYDEISPAHTSSSPTIAGVMLVLAGLLAVGQGAVYVLADNMVSSLPGYYGGSSLCLCGSLDIIFGLAAFGGAFSCFGRGNFWLAIIGAILGMLGLGFLLGGLFGLIGLIFVAISKDEFND